MKFLIWLSNNRWYWTLHDGTDRIAQCSREYHTEEECLGSIERFRRIAATAPIADRTDEQEQ